MSHEATTEFFVDGELAENLWAIYQAAFENADEGGCAQTQTCYDWHSFQEAMHDRDYAKVIAWRDGVPVGLSLLTNNLEKAKITYVNPEKLRKLHPEEAAEGRIWYCTATVIPPQAQGRGNSAGLFDGMVALLLKYRAVLAFDYGEDKPEFEHYVTMMFHRALRRAGRAPEKAVPVKPIGGQVYCTLDCFQD